MWSSYVYHHGYHFRKKKATVQEQTDPQKHCSNDGLCFIIIVHNDKKNNKVALPDNFNVKIFERMKSYRLIQQLLMEAGDVESNPGPETPEYRSMIDNARCLKDALGDDNEIVTELRNAKVIDDGKFDELNESTVQVKARELFRIIRNAVKNNSEFYHEFLLPHMRGKPIYMRLRSIAEYQEQSSSAGPLTNKSASFINGVVLIIRSVKSIIKPLFLWNMLHNCFVKLCDTAIEITKLIVSDNEANKKSVDQLNKKSEDIKVSQAESSSETPVTEVDHTSNDVQGTSEGSRGSKLESGFGHTKNPDNDIVTPNNMTVPVGTASNTTATSAEQPRSPTTEQQCIDENTCTSKNDTSLTTQGGALGVIMGASLHLWLIMKITLVIALVWLTCNRIIYGRLKWRRVLQFVVAINVSSFGGVVSKMLIEYIIDSISNGWVSYVFGIIIRVFVISVLLLCLILILFCKKRH